MYATKPSQPLSLPSRRPRRSPHTKARRRGLYQRMAYETSARLVVNVVMSCVAVSALVHLMPYRSSQDVRLQELQVAVKSTGERVQRVQSSFNYFFDPSQARSIMEQQSNRIDPLRRPVIWQQANQPTQPMTPSAAPATDNGE